MNKPIFIDAHQDIAWNMLTFGRDYTRSVAETRALEKGTDTPNRNGDTLLGWEEYQEGNVAVIFATLFASPARRKLGDWDQLSYANDEEASKAYSAQLDAYHKLFDEHPDKFSLILDRKQLSAHLQQWQEKENSPVGFVILMEGAEGVRSVDELEMWYERGVRIIGPAWTGTRYCGGTHEPGPLTKEGYALLDGMAEYNFILDVSHMDEQAVLQALDHYPGKVIASHTSAATVLKGFDTNRFLSDHALTRIIERDGVIGVVPSNWFLLYEWKAKGGRSAVSINHLVAIIDHICQLAGDAKHVGIGSDFDGGFGVQSVPVDIDTIADMQKIVLPLQGKGYTEADIGKILGKNWQRVLEETLS